MVMALAEIGGFIFQDARQGIQSLSEEAVEQFTSDPMGVLWQPARIMDILGRGTFLQVFAYQVFKATSACESREQVCDALLECCVEDKVLFFVFCDTQVVRENFVEASNGVLNSVLSCDPIHGFGSFLVLRV